MNLFQCLAVPAACVASLTISANLAAQSVIVGQTVALSGPLELHGKGLQLGVQAALAEFNARSGRPFEVKLVALDDKGDSKVAAENVSRLVSEHRVVSLVAGAEGGPCVAALEAAKRLATPQVGCAGGSPELREISEEFSFPVRASHLAEFELIVAQSTTLGERKFAFVHADTATGRRHLDNVKRLMTKYQAELVAAIPLTKETTAASALAQLKATGAQRVFNHGSIGFFSALMKESIQAGGKTKFTAISSGMQMLLSDPGTRASVSGLEFTQIVPSPFRSVGVSLAYRRAMHAHFPGQALGVSSLEGYISARVLLRAMERVRGQVNALTLSKSLAVLTEDVEGFHVNMTELKNRGSTFVDIGIVTKVGSTIF